MPKQTQPKPIDHGMLDLYAEHNLKKIVSEIVTERMNRKTKINWKFTREKAREKLPELYRESIVRV